MVDGIARPECALFDRRLAVDEENSSDRQFDLKDEYTKEVLQNWIGLDASDKKQRCFSFLCGVNSK